MFCGLLMIISHVFVSKPHSTVRKATHKRLYLKVHCFLMRMKIRFLLMQTHNWYFKVRKWNQKIRIHVAFVTCCFMIGGLTVENVQSQPLNSHLKGSDEVLASCVRRCLFMFFFSCLVPQVSQVTYWWQDLTWALRHSALVKNFMQPGSKHTTSTVSSLTAE
jgi:hypothetical protein